MSTATKPAPAKKAAPAKAKEVAKVPAKKEAKEVGVKTYRDLDEFKPALTAAKSLAKGNPELTAPLQLITHLAWKTPGGKVGWANNTTQAVIDYAEDLAVPEGTAIPEALTAALTAATKGAKDKPQKDAVAVLSKVIKAHG
jgi:hypothetical protein